jgi:ParB family chromosome partitioning protein
MENKLDMGHARALLPLESSHQIMLANKIALEQLSVREAEKLVQKLTGDQKPEKHRKVARLSRDTQHLQEQMSECLGTRVEIKPGKKGSGKLVIEYASHDQLDEYLGYLRNGK